MYTKTDIENCMVVDWATLIMFVLNKYIHYGASNVCMKESIRLEREN